MKQFLLSLVIVLSLVGVGIATRADDGTTKPVPAPIVLTGESAQQVKDAYSALLMASKDYENAVLRAKIALDVPKEWGFNLNAFRFEPPAVVGQSPAAPPAQPKPKQ